ncbi:hypothetical protein [Alicyclobacillus fodiniaquatilis]|jgi:putative membrane protein|uniref:SHOCT domain-containing protein n=1 Tax=Alicyclobacillus fodiniaquatilis TaxID=1661150 RepID=A0ABW4JK65_9BACL
MSNHHFSFFPFGVLYCLTLFAFLVAYMASRFMLRRQNAKQPMIDALAVLKYRFAVGEMSESEYQKLKELLCK